jgi:hypothetical protein
VAQKESCSNRSSKSAIALPTNERKTRLPGEYIMKKILAFLPLVLPRVSSRCKHLYHRLVHHREAFGGSMHKRFGHEDIRLPTAWRMAIQMPPLLFTSLF